ncbi:hypothetical protein CRG98_021320 [Punica granatum]|uniref:Uncharacterized protein n=1 Tax=Punica granatum TaxID=22663 RepID=A0A2I0JPL3_PUNGR|nr:hypothetical protein CRG98_021320 [Punica granatum]
MNRLCIVIFLRMLAYGSFTAMYASPSIMNRRDLWSFLSTISAGNTGPWVVLGGFNAILNASEKKGRAPFNPIPAAHFQEALDNCGLMDLESSGPRFTWRGPVQLGYEQLGTNLFLSRLEAKLSAELEENRRSIAEVNDTLLVLIPKVPQQETLYNFRPISLCNVAFKLVTRLIANRLQRYMSNLISLNQVSFVPGRHIQDNIVITQELVHTMSRMQGKKLFMSIKIDLEKAYDRLSWDFIRDTLVTAGFPSNLRRVILQCIMTASMQVLWNGELTESFNMGRRIRHGSPISQLMFVDDLLLFSEASMEQVQVIKSVLDAFCAASGQKELYMGSLGRPEEASLGRLGDPYMDVVEGGLGLRRLRQANDPFLAKLGWGLLTENEALWVRGSARRFVRPTSGGFCIRQWQLELERILGLVGSLFDVEVVAELWGVLSGLELAWELGYRLVLLEVDSLLVTRLIAGSGPRAPQLRTIVREIRSWLERDWQVEVSHRYREGNSVAD